MIPTLKHGARKLAVIACAMSLVACAGTGEQSGYKQLKSEDVAKVTQGMTRQEVEQEFGRPRGSRRDRQGNDVLLYEYASAPSSFKSLLWVTIDPASGKVMKVEAQNW